MKKRNLIFVAFAIAMLVLGGCAKDETVKQNNDADSMLTQVVLTNMNDAVYLKYTDNTNTITLVNTDGIWYFEDDTETWLDQEVVISVTDKARKLVAVDVVEDAKALTEYGLDKPAYTVGIKDGEGNEVLIYIGDADEAGNYYVTIGEKEEVYVISEQFVTALHFDKEMFVENIEDEIYEEDVYEEEIIEEEPTVDEETVEDTSSESEE